MAAALWSREKRDELFLFGLACDWVRQLMTPLAEQAEIVYGLRLRLTLGLFSKWHKLPVPHVA